MTTLSQQNAPHIATDFSSAFGVPRHLSKSAWLGHIPFAFWLVEKLRPTTIVELGTHTGASYFAFCQAVAELKLPTTCYAVDTWEGDEQAGFYDESVFQSVRDINAASYSQFSHLLRMTFDEALDQVSDESIDLLHIDGLHTYEAVKHDFETWLPKLSNRAVVLFHDTEIMRPDFAVHKLFAELSDRYPCSQFQHSAGLGVAFVGGDYDPKILATLLSDYTKTLFEKLGERVDMTYQLKVATDRIQALTDEVNALSAQHLSQKKELDSQISKLADIGDILMDVIIEKEDLENRRRREKALMTFIHSYYKRRRYPLQRLLSNRKSIKTIRESGEFDVDWYLMRYPDIRKTGVDPIEHYFFHGVFEGRNPSADFDTVQYLLNHTDVAKAGVNPMLHYVKAGKRENRRLGPDENGR